MNVRRVMETLGVVSLGVWTVSAITLRQAIRRRRVLWLEEIRAAEDDECPTLSVIVPACNEADTVEPAMRSLLSVDYPQLEIVAVDDRSTDDTGAILDRMAAGDSRLHVLHLSSLPPGWLGKNHALWKGAGASSGEFILFTDADVLFQRDSLRRAMALVRERQADHLVVAPWVILRGFWEQLLVSYFMVMFTLHTRAWDVDNPRSQSHIGIGAFNLLRRSAYESFGGHSALPMDVADDLKLGKMLKLSGKRQVYILGGELVQVRWVSGLAGFVDGLTKNMFGGIGYRRDILLGVTLVLVGTTILPAPGLFWGSLRSRLACAGALLAMAVCATPPPPPRRLQEDALPARDESGKDGGSSRLKPPGSVCGLGYPLASLIWLYTIWRSAVLAERAGGIHWRGTFYPLKELRRNVV